MLKKLGLMIVLFGLTLIGSPVPQASAALPYCYSACPLYGGSDLVECWCLNRIATNCAEWSQCQEYWGNP